VNPPALPLTKVRPQNGWQALNLAQLWHARDLLLAFAARDVKLRYRQTALGIAWVLLLPLVSAGIFSFVFGKVAGLNTGFPFSYVGLLCWNAFGSTLTKTSGSLVQNSGLISKIFFPRLILPASTILSTLLDFLVALAIFPVLLFIYKIPVTPAIALLPFWLLLTILLATGCGLFAAALMVSYRDVQHILPVLIPFLLYASPVGYAVPARYHSVFAWNPLTAILNGFRWSLLGTGGPSWQAVLYSSAVAVAVLLGGIFAFKNKEREFADVI
jgi:lipopolysaccharide transport system permease protein